MGFCYDAEILLNQQIVGSPVLHSYLQLKSMCAEAYYGVQRTPSEFGISTAQGQGCSTFSNLSTGGQPRVIYQFQQAHF
jgi:hypothetical protein